MGSSCSYFLSSHLFTCSLWVHLIQYMYAVITCLQMFIMSPPYRCMLSSHAFTCSLFESSQVWFHSLRIRQAVYKWIPRDKSWGELVFLLAVLFYCYSMFVFLCFEDRKTWYKLGSLFHQVWDSIFYRTLILFQYIC